jgi:tetratricopeptide (TPR) repeat protein
MKSEKWHLGAWFAVLFLSSGLFSACGPSFQAGGSIAQGRQAMFRGDYPTALAYFQSAEQTDPNYIWGAELREGVLSYVGRAQYLNGDLAPARQTLERAVAQYRADNLAKLYLGLTLARLNDRTTGLVQIDAGLKGVRDFLNYITNTFSSSFGQFWDPNQDIRKAIASNLALIAREGFDWPTVIANSESIAMNFEQEPDRATRQEEQQMQMDRSR